MLCFAPNKKLLQSNRQTMKNLSFENLFESDLAKIVQKKGASNKVKIETLKKMITLIIKQELTEKQKKVLQLYFIYNFKYNEIAKMLNVNKSTISRIKTRAFKTIEKILKYYDFR